MAAACLRLIARFGPIVLAFAVAGFVGRSLERADGLAGLVLWLAMVWTVSTATLVVADRLLQQLLPLATLLRLSLVFPDEAPSRFRFALRTGTAKHLERKLEAGDLGRTEGEAARTLLTLMTVLRDHDRVTRGHSERVRAYSMLIAERMELSQAQCDRLQWGALAHDVGKLAVAPAILNKSGRLSENEWHEMRSHPAAAESLIEPLRNWLGEWADAATQHHERFDGRGYPHGLSADEITLAGRIVAVADAFDTMTSKRSYKAALAPEDALTEITHNAGSQFDPEVVRAFLAVPLRRVRLVAGSFGWLGHIPFAGEVTAVSAAGGSAAVAATAIVAATAVFTGTIDPSFDLGADDRTPAGWIETASPSSSGAARVIDPGEPIDVTTSTTLVAADGGEVGPLEPSVPASSDSPGSTTTSTPTATTTTTTTIASTPVSFGVNDAFSTHAGTSRSMNVLANDREVNDNIVPSSVRVVIEPTHAVEWWVNPGGTVGYSAREVDDPQYSSTDSFVYEACDRDGACDTATVTITIAP